MRSLIVCFLCLCGTLSAQKKVIDHTVYNDWKRVGEVKVSADGKFSSYTIKPHRGDGYLYIINHETGKKDSIFRGTAPVFSGDNSFLAFKITPGFDTLRKSELNKVKKDLWPKDSLGIYFLSNDSLIKYPKVKSFQVAENGAWLVYLSDNNKLPAPKAKKKCLFRKKPKAEKKYDSDGKVMVLLQPSLKKEEKIKDVKETIMPEKGDYFAYVIHQKEKVDSFEIVVRSPHETSPWKIPQKFNAVSGISFNKKGTELVFAASMDTLDKAKSFRLYHADLAAHTLRLLVDTVQSGLPDGFRVSMNQAPYFSANGKRVFFGIALKPKVDPKDTLLENEKAKLDVWHWKDDRLQPQQLLEKGDDESKTRLSVYDLGKNEFTILGADTLSVRPVNKGNADFALAYSIKSYENAYNWEYPNKRDFYRINLLTGATELIKKGVVYQVSLSPSGKYFTYFDEQTQDQYMLDLDTRKTNCMTCGQKEEWLDDVNGMPHVASPYGIKGWFRGEKELVIQSKYDLWVYNVATSKLSALTQDGKAQNIRLSLEEWNNDSTYIDFENAYITGFHQKDKSMSLYEAHLEDGQLKLVLQFHTPHSLSGFKKAKKANQYVFQRASVQDYPDLHLAEWKNPAPAKQISVTNPQQSDYNWATVELVSWKSYNNVPLEGLLYKPENYDSTKKYPLLVYFYEMYSDELHNHYAPRPTASIIFPTEYASAGYFILIPDIRYQPGYPARGAYDCIMSGTDYVLKKYRSVDSTRMGLQGQSWGGYQTAQLITMTNRYKAAMAGAPVGNMFSAYGGIRWGSGLNRQFQYEKTQSRIGKTIWEAPELYVENSPLFHLPRVTTPLLIMHNDGDGAVPWYQGIELFTGLKRLNKPAWLLNYNGDDHNLMKNANRIDLSIRMRQFFDYYLMDVPAPKWLKDGVPAVDKGINYGLDR